MRGLAAVALLSVFCTLAKGDQFVQGRLPNGQPVIIVIQEPPRPRPVIIVKPRPISPEVRRAMSGVTLNPKYVEPNVVLPRTIYNPWAAPHWKGLRHPPQK